jgi:hypothetical protein
MKTAIGLQVGMRLPMPNSFHRLLVGAMVRVRDGIRVRELHRANITNRTKE